MYCFFICFLCGEAVPVLQEAGLEKLAQECRVGYARLGSCAVNVDFRTLGVWLCLPLIYGEIAASACQPSTVICQLLLAYICNTSAVRKKDILY